MCVMYADCSTFKHQHLHTDNILLFAEARDGWFNSVRQLLGESTKCEGNVRRGEETSGEERPRQESLFQLAASKRIRDEQHK